MAAPPLLPGTFQLSVTSPAVRAGGGGQIRGCAGEGLRPRLTGQAQQRAEGEQAPPPEIARTETDSRSAVRLRGAPILLSIVKPLIRYILPSPEGRTTATLSWP